MISQPKLKVIHPPNEVWDTQITVRPFVVNHQVATNAEHAERLVRRRAEHAASPKSKVPSPKPNASRLTS